MKAYDAEEHDGREYLVMEYVPGENLRTLLQREGTFSIPDACAVVHEVAIGLQYLHERHFVHRDIKPSNIVLSTDRAVKILDLGLAISSGERDDDSHRRSADGLLQGTLDFMSPEQSTNSSLVTAAADLYSLGATFFSLLTGVPPFADSDTRSEKIDSVRNRTPPAVMEIRPDVPKAIGGLIARLLEKSPDAD